MTASGGAEPAGRAAPARAGEARAARAGRSRRARQQLWGLGFLLPTLLLLAVFKLLPMLQAFRLSLTSYDLLGPPAFVGLANYAALLQDPRFHRSAWATVYYVLGTCVPIWVLSLALALVLDSALPARRFLRLLYFVPAVVPIVVHGTIWRFMLHPHGLVNGALRAIGLPPVDWLTDVRAAVPGLILASDWRFVPYFMVVYLAGLQGVPAEYHEAAAIDGATGFQRFRYVTVPLLRPTILLVVVVSIVLTGKAFTGILVITGGGPDDASRVLSLFVYQAGFQFLKMGMASAASVLLLVATLAFTLVQLRLWRDDRP